MTLHDETQHAIKAELIAQSYGGYVCLALVAANLHGGTRHGVVFAILALALGCLAWRAAAIASSSTVVDILSLSGVLLAIASLVNYAWGLP